VLSSRAIKDGVAIELDLIPSLDQLAVGVQARSSASTPKAFVKLKAVHPRSQSITEQPPMSKRWDLSIVDE